MILRRAEGKASGVTKPAAIRRRADIKAAYDPPALEGFRVERFAGACGWVLAVLAVTMSLTPAKAAAEPAAAKPRLSFEPRGAELFGRPAVPDRARSRRARAGLAIAPGMEIFLQSRKLKDNPPWADTQDAREDRGRLYSIGLSARW